MKSFITSLLLILSTSLFGQVQFKKGYILNSNNEKFECLIEDKNWIHTPDSIKYKITDFDKITTANFNSIYEFQIYETGHYYKKFTYQLNSIETTSFLRILVKGNASLFELNDSDKGVFYFYNTIEKPIKQLIYSNKINNFEDYRFRKELFENVFCQYNNSENIRRLEYDKQVLIKYFEKYNECVNAEYTNFDVKHFKLNFRYGINGGYTSNASNILIYIGYDGFDGAPSTGGITFEGKNESHPIQSTSNSYTFGGEFEVLFKYNNLNWSFYTSPNYNFGKQGKTIDIDYNYGTIIYKSKVQINKRSFIEVPIGLRYYFNLNQNSSVNVGFAYNFNYNLGGNKVYNIESNAKIKNSSEYDLNIPSNISLSVGYNYKNKYNLSIIYHPKREFEQGISKIELKNSTTFSLKYF